MYDPMNKINKLLTENQKNFRKMSQAFKPIQNSVAKVARSINQHQETINKYLVHIYEAIEVFDSIDFDELNDRFYKQLSSNGWAVVLEIAFTDMFTIMEYEDEDEDGVDEQQLMKILYGVFEYTEADLEANLCRFLGENNTTFINKQFTLMRLGYRLNSIPVLIILVEKTIKKLADKDGKIVSNSEIKGLLEEQIDKLINEETEDEEKQKLIDTYTEAFKNNIKIIENTFNFYNQEKPHKTKGIREMGIINRNQVFHTAIDLDEANEIHFYKLYFILMFLMEIRTLKEKLLEE